MSVSALQAAMMAALIALGAGVFAAVDAADASGLKAWLEPTPRGDVIEFQGYVTASKPMLVSYRLKIARISRGGRATTAQGGQVNIVHADEPTPLSLTAINVGSDDFYEAELTVTGPGGEQVTVELTRKPDDVKKI